MFETNTAACGGFPNIFDLFGASLWAIASVLKLATRNLSTALLHVSGERDYYGLFGLRVPTCLPSVNGPPGLSTTPLLSPLISSARAASQGLWI